MKKQLLFSVLALILILPVSAQKITFNDQPSDKRPFGLSIGFVSKQNRYTEIYEEGTMRYREGIFGSEWRAFTPAVKIGFTVVPEFKYGIGIQTGAYLETAIQKFHGSYAHSYTRYLDLTVSVPIRLQYRYSITEHFSCLVYAGPSFDFGAFRGRNSMSPVYGKETFEDNGGNWYEMETHHVMNYETGDSVLVKDRYIGFNCMFGVGGGLQYKGLQLRVGGEFSLKPTGDAEEFVRYAKPVEVMITYLF